MRPDGRTEISLLTFGSDLEGPRALRKIHPEGWNAQQEWEETQLKAKHLISIAGGELS